MAHCRVAPVPDHVETLVGQSQGTGGACDASSSTVPGGLILADLSVGRWPHLSL